MILQVVVLECQRLSVENRLVVLYSSNVHLFRLSDEVCPWCLIPRYVLVIAPYLLVTRALHSHLVCLGYIELASRGHLSRLRVNRRPSVSANVIVAFQRLGRVLSLFERGVSQRVAKTVIRYKPAKRSD